MLTRARKDEIISGLKKDLENAKAVFLTDRGLFGYNKASDSLTEVSIEFCDESRIEIISDRVDDQWEVQLLSCIVTEDPLQNG